MAKSQEPPTHKMIVITGAYGFIGSCLASSFNQQLRSDLILVDDFSKQEKHKNLVGKSYYTKVDRDDFIAWFSKHYEDVSFCFHIGARTDTAEFDYSVLEKLNLEYSKKIWEICTRHEIPLVYASSAATYGDGSLGFDDNHKLPYHLEPLNPYGISKNEFDNWVLNQKEAPPFWAGLKFFNVYGPNEYHKGRMASVVYHFYNQVRETECVKLFRSHKPEYLDGEQMRDFIHVHDLLAVMEFLMKKQDNISSGLYNLGTGKARTYNDLAKAIFSSMDLYPDIEYIDIPADIRESYQYFTEANMDKLRKAGYRKSFISLEKGIEQYVKEYLIPGRHY